MRLLKRQIYKSLFNRPAVKAQVYTTGRGGVAHAVPLPNSGPYSL